MVGFRNALFCISESLKCVPFRFRDRKKSVLVYDRKNSREMSISVTVAYMGG